MNGRFAVKHFCPFLQTDGFIMECWTDTECHLWLRYSTRKPSVHLETIYRRGLPMHDNPRFCFTRVADIEQHEAGDTLAHSFNVHPIKKSLNIYFYLYGYIGGVLSPSTSPIMKYPFHTHEPLEHKHSTGDADVGHAITYNTPRAMSFTPWHSIRWTGIKLYIYGHNPAYKVSLHLYKTDGNKRPLGAPVANCYLAHIPYKRLWPDKGYLFFPFEHYQIFPDYYYAIAAFGDPDYPDTTCMWWSNKSLPPFFPGDVAWWGERVGNAYNWYKHREKVLQYQIWSRTGYVMPCPRFPANITP